MGDDYRHTQKGYLMVGVLGAAAVVTGSIFLAVRGEHGSAAAISASVCAILLAFAYLFHSLKVEVSAERIRLRFGPGLVRVKFDIADITGARVVRNRWYFGWGIKWIARGWLFNVSGLDAVEIDHRGGRRYRIGTDEPAELLAAIRGVIAS